MSKQTDDQRFVAIVQRNRPLTEIVNAIAHLALGLGNHDNTSNASYSTFNNVDVPAVSYLTDHPLIILSAKSSKELYNIHRSVLETSIPCNVFFDNMFSPDVNQQLKEVASTSLEDLNYVAIMLYGGIDELKPFTKKFSLLRNPILKDSSVVSF